MFCTAIYHTVSTGSRRCTRFARKPAMPSILLPTEAASTTSRSLEVCTSILYICDFGYFFAHISSYAHRSHKLRPSGHGRGGLGSIRAVCRAWRALQVFLGAGGDKMICWVFFMRLHVTDRVKRISRRSRNTHAWTDTYQTQA